MTFDSVSLLVHALEAHEFIIVDNAMDQELSVLPLAFGSVILERWDRTRFRARRFYLKAEDVVKLANWLNENTPDFSPIAQLEELG